DATLLERINDLYPHAGKRLVLHKRDVSLASINSSIWATLRALDEDPTIKCLDAQAYCLLYIEAPFRGGKYIDKAVNTMRVFNVDTVDGVVQDSSFFYQHSGQGMTPLNRRPFFQFERDEIYRRC